MQYLFVAIHTGWKKEGTGVTYFYDYCVFWLTLLSGHVLHSISPKVQILILVDFNFQKFI
jgi:hypothetical protein